MERSISDLNIPTLAEKISVELLQRLEYTSFYNELQKVATSDDVTLEDFSNSLLSQLSRRRLDTKLRNMVYYWLKEKCFSYKYCSLEPLDYMKKCQESWESRIWKSLLSMSHHLGIPLARARLNSEQESVEENWSEFSQWEIDLSRCKPVYSPKDFLDCILQVVSPNYQFNGTEKLWSSLASIPMKVKSLRELKSLFGDLTRGDPHFGLNRCSDIEWESSGNYSRNGTPKLIYTHRVRLAETIISRGLAPVAQEFLKKGCPPCLRSKIWQLILGSFITSEHINYYQELRQAVIKSDLIVDRLILKDVQLTAANDDQYFVFEDSLYQMLLCFSRDISLLDLFDRSSKNPLTAQVKGKGKHMDTSVIYPPNGIVPFHGFTMYVAPLCYLYDDPETLFFTFRSLYIRYWYRLHEISSNEDGIIGLSILFEKLLHRHETQLWFHLRSLRVLPNCLPWFKIKGNNHFRRGSSNIGVGPIKGIPHNELKPACAAGGTGTSSFHQTDRFVKAQMVSDLSHLLDKSQMLRLRVVFKWLMKAFSGYLPAEQVLQLWDLLLAYNSIQILPLFAMGVLSIRKENLMKAQLPQTVDAVLADLSSIRVLPVLQLALSKETF